MVLTVLEAKKLTVPRLKEELTKRGLDSTGNKPDLLARLIESINQAAEDLILSDAGGAADHHLLSDDILNDDLLDAGIDGDDDAEDKLLTSAVETTTSVDAEAEIAEEAPKTEKKEIVLTEKKTEGGVDEAQRARAIRFGLPLTSEALASDTAKTARAKRFDLPEDAKRLSSDELKAKRAERFGTSNTTEKESPAAIDEKKAARAARFGLPVGGGKGADAEKLAARAKRFSNGKDDDEETKAKKQARLERFGAGAQ